jgi:hypothetical protein
VTFAAARLALGELALVPAFLIEVTLFGLVYVLAWILLPGGRAAVVELGRALRDVAGRGAAGTAAESTETQVVP